MIGLGLIGFGMIGKSFAAAAEQAGFTVRAVMSRTADAPIDGVEQARVHRDLGEFLADEGVEAVVVCTPHWMHAADAIACLESSKHVLVEKPVVTDLTQLADLRRAADNSTAIAVGLPHGRLEYLDVARNTIESGRIGPVTMIESVLDVPGPPRSNWYYGKDAVGGASFDTLPYALDRVLRLLGTAPASVTGSVSRLIRRRLCGDGGTIEPSVDDSASLVLVMPDGQQALVRSNWCVAAPDDRLTVHGRSGRLDIDCWRRAVEVTDSTGVEVVAGGGAQSSEEARKLELFRSCIEQRTGDLTIPFLTMEYILAVRAKSPALSAPTGPRELGTRLRQLQPPDGYW